MPGLKGPVQLRGAEKASERGGGERDGGGAKPQGGSDRGHTTEG